jgi:hypothetical protein
MAPFGREAEEVNGENCRYVLIKIICSGAWFGITFFFSFTKSWNFCEEGSRATKFKNGEPRTFND